MVTWTVGTALLLGAPLAVAQPPSEGAPPTESAPSEPAEEPEETDPPPAEPDPQPPSNPNLQEAKRLFREGNALREAHNCEGALARYKASRALVPSVPNVLNAAVCLRELGRYDEALEHYEDLVTQFRDKLTDSERDLIGPAMKRLVARLGTVDVRVNVTKGTLMVGGRLRGELPLLRPLHLLPGSHDVRVLRDGYQPYDESVEITAAQTTVVEAKLKPLAVVGRLRLDDEALDGAEVFVDGSPVGIAPFDSILAAGKHWVVVRKGDRGIAPTEVIIVEGQIAGIALHLLPLGPELLVTAKPARAALSIGDTRVGNGTWRGRLPIRSHTITVREEGYVTQIVSIAVTETGPKSRTIALVIDDEHPRWGVSEGLFLLEGIGGLALAATLKSGAEESCETLSCPANPLAFGLLFGASAAYELPIRFSVGIAGGYVRFQKSLKRELSVTQTFKLAAPRDEVDQTGRFELSDALTFSGPFVGATMGYRHPISELLEVRANMLLGVMLANMRHRVNASVSSGGTTASVVVAGEDDTGALDVLVMPELHLGIRSAGINASVGLSLPIFALRGPSNAHSSAQPQPTSNCAEDPGPGCFQGQGITEAEDTFGPFVALLPSMRVGYSF